MKKILIGLLVVAAATAAYFFLYKKDTDKPAQQATTQELIIGKWKTSSVLPATDSLITSYNYDFQKEGKLFRSVSDSAKADTLLYEWNKAGELLIKSNASDTTAKIFVTTLTGNDSLTLKTDSLSMLLLKQK